MNMPRHRRLDPRGRHLHARQDGQVRELDREKLHGVALLLIHRPENDVQQAYLPIAKARLGGQGQRRRVWGVKETARGRMYTTRMAASRFPSELTT